MAPTKERISPLAAQVIFAFIDAMKTADFDFDLPPDCIALRPVEPRHAARLLVVDPARGAEFHDSAIWDLPSFLKPGDALVVNNTRVIPAELTGTRTRGASTITIHVTLHQRRDDQTWRAFAKPGRRLKPGDEIHFAPGAGAALTGHVRAKGAGGEIELLFNLAGAALEAALGEIGTMPLPTYIASKRAVDDKDNAAYQTMFAGRSGAVAAPTAGLHFTPQLIEALAAHGIELHQITLHVGAGTFLPVKADLVSDHKMHSEWGEITPETAAALQAVKARGNRVIAVGTTSLRILETAARASGQVSAFCGETDIFITPGYRFRAIDGLMTNFHLPRSTLFMLVSALAGLEKMKAAYIHAIENGYRFYSYGDACLLFPKTAS